MAEVCLNSIALQTKCNDAFGISDIFFKFFQKNCLKSELYTWFFCKQQLEQYKQNWISFAHFSLSFDIAPLSFQLFNFIVFQSVIKNEFLLLFNTQKKWLRILQTRTKRPQFLKPTTF